jgi:hypothetical protein
MGMTNKSNPHMIDPLFIMRNVKLKLYCPGNLKISATTKGLSAAL